MFLSLESNYKSLEPFCIDMPDFVLLTGLNGSGKTQMLFAIANGKIKVKLNEEIVNKKDIKYIPSNALVPQDSATVTSQDSISTIETEWSNYKNNRIRLDENPQLTLEIIYKDSLNKLKNIREIAKDAGKDILTLTQDDFYRHFPIYHDLNHNDIFVNSFSTIFKRYRDKYEDNEYTKYRNESNKGNNESFLTESDFLKLYGEAPWDFLNKILEKSELDYHINSPLNIHRNTPFGLKLVNNLNGSEIKFSDLSSGEKVLMSLSLALYNSNYDIQFPKILLIDEPDASLHPSMSKQFLKVLQDLFVMQKGVKVIFSTHSPSTVALSPQEAIFLTNKIGVRVEKASKDKALKILTSGVPSFSINYENRRQVFVESENDVLYYEKIYQKLSNYLIPEISITFISSGETRTDKHGTKISNSNQVSNITNILRGAGNKFIWGIIDRDKENQSSEFIKVMGESNRYSIENYIFDPLLLAALLLREKKVTREELNMKETETYVDFKHFGNERLQHIANFVISKISQKVNPTSSETKVVRLINNKTITIPTWFLDYQGHSLENLILEIFPELGSLKRGKEEALKLEIINKIIDDIPDILSIDFLNVFKEIQTA